MRFMPLISADGCACNIFGYNCYILAQLCKLPPKENSTTKIEAKRAQCVSSHMGNEWLVNRRFLRRSLFWNLWRLCYATIAAAKRVGKTWRYWSTRYHCCCTTFSTFWCLFFTMHSLIQTNNVGVVTWHVRWMFCHFFMWSTSSLAISTLSHAPWKVCRYYINGICKLLGSIRLPTTLI